MLIEGNSALVTGGASGLGEATARAIVERGGRVALVDMNADKGQALASELGDAAVFVQADVTSEEDIGAAIEKAEQLGPLRAAVSCAGIAWATRTVNKDGMAHPLDAFAKIIQVNLIGTFNVMRLCAAAMTKNNPLADGERGVVVNTASIAAFDGQIGQAAYAASKAGVAGLTLPAARDLAKAGIRVLAIAPGTFDTPMLALLPEEARQALAAGIPFPQRLGAPADFAKLAVHLIENGYLNGETIRLDGALRMPPK
ncbi:MAG: 3-hydroxyacyl-CoA dehydrogenase [Myxococcales bacterium]|nr:3-hydroxyacyl-CoA dehydrogenase [Myxococcales bacterium]MDD9967426.1 3-hydroxyacyl-CoA dehydrogenase [Myxococcales bacterium]